MKVKLKKSILAATAKILLVVIISCTSSHSRSNENKSTTTSNQRIMLALLLDTSNSMDGLIEQAKSQLWTVVNELTSAKCDDGNPPEVNIALYEYGNDGLPSSEGYIRMVVNLTSDLDELSEKLFSLTTNGGNEFCGQVIQTSIDQLNWSKSDADLKMIFISGNEPFTQGVIPYKEACRLAKDNDIVVNTIFCGPHDTGINTSWKAGADLTGGSYMSIEQDRKTVYVKTPYDARIDEFNEKLNKTYIYYGADGKEKFEKQRMQDQNAESYSRSNKVKRAISKSSYLYKNSQWDLVDAYKDDRSVMEDLDEKHLPENMKLMSEQERKQYVQKQALEREKIQKEIQTLAIKRKEYVAANQPKDDADGMLDKAMIKSIKEVAKTKNLKFE